MPTVVPAMRPGPRRQLSLVSVPGLEEDRIEVHVAGELDLGTAPLCLSELNALAQAGYRNADLHLLGLTFCDAAGLTALLEGQRTFAARGGGILLHDPCSSLRRILDICDLTLALEDRSRRQTDGVPGFEGTLSVDP